MTRLKTEWIEHMPEGMIEYNEGLRARTGFDLVGLVRETFCISEEKYSGLKDKLLVAAVPVTQGQGIIGCFAESVAAIVRSMGFNTFVTEETDVDGIYSAVLRDADVIFMADDTRYLAFSRDNGGFGENNYSTALGYVMAMKSMLKNAGRDIRNEKLLVIGYGLVGEEACRILSDKGINFDMYDRDPDVLRAFSGDYPEAHVLQDKDEIKNYSCILDFTNEGEWLKDEYLCDDVLYASPGVPLSLDETAKQRLSGTAVYDNLEIGTAVMLGEILKTMM